MKTQEPITDNEINLPIIVHENELVIATKFVEPEITKEPHELTIVEGDFSHTVDSVSKGGEEEIKFVPELVAISSHGSDFVAEQKRDVDLKTFFSATSTPSTKTKVWRGIAITETPSKPSQFLFNLSYFHICIFDPGGILKVTVCSVVRRRLPILSFRNFTMFTFGYGASFPATTTLPVHRIHIISLLSLVWEP